MMEDNPIDLSDVTRYKRAPGYLTSLGLTVGVFAVFLFGLFTLENPVSAGIIMTVVALSAVGLLARN